MQKPYPTKKVVAKSRSDEAIDHLKPAKPLVLPSKLVLPPLTYSVGTSPPSSPPFDPEIPQLVPMAQHTGFYVSLESVRGRVFSARNILFSVKAQRDQTILALHALINSATDYATAPNGVLVNVASGTVADLLQRIIMSLDFGERGVGPDEVGSYQDAHVSFVKGCAQLLRICDTVNGPVATANGIVTKP